MKIAFILPSLANKGPVIMVRDLMGFLVENGHVCDVFYFDNIIQLDFPCRTKRISFFKSITFKDYQVIHSHLFRPDLYCAVHKRKIPRNTKVISTLHTAVYDDLIYTHGSLKSWLTIPIWIKALKAMDHIVLLTNAASSYYAKTNFRNTSVIENGRDIPQTQGPIPEKDLLLIENLKRDHLLLGCVSILDKRKGIEQIIPLLQRRKEYACIIVGDGSEWHELELLAEKYHVSDRFKIIGSRAEGFRYIAKLDLFLLPSRSEGMPLALIEAMAQQVPVVCSNIPAFTAALSPEEAGFFSLDDLDSLENTCLHALENKIKLTAAAYLLYTRKHGVDIMGNAYLKLYNNL
jgi:glycosyltransferase involved in cell wall biosynthesis